MIPLYFFKNWEELAKGITVGVGSYLVMTVTAQGFPTTQQALTALLTGAVPIVYAAFRTWLNATPLTPNGLAAGPSTASKP